MITFQKKLPLEGLLVLDFSRFLPGPLCTLYLADLGARVIKIEEPGSGDFCRHLPPLLGSEGAYFMMLNRNKESLTLNLKSKEGQTIAKKLATKGDILVENFRPGIMKKFGLSFEELSRLNSKLIYCSITGFGQESPWRNLGGHDPNYAALSGVSSTIRGKDGTPVLPGVQIADVCGGTFPALTSILVALYQRTFSGKGACLDISITDGALASLMMVLGAHFATGREIAPGAEFVTGNLPHCSIYPTRDGRFLAVAALEEKFWKRLCELLNLEDLASLHFGSSLAKEASALKKIRQTLEEKFKTFPLSYWTKLFENEDVCVSPILTTSEALRTDHAKARDLLFTIKHGKEEIPQLKLPTNLPTRTHHSPPPKLGEHTEKILKELGL